MPGTAADLWTVLRQDAFDFRTERNRGTYVHLCRWAGQSQISGHHRRRGAHSTGLWYAEYAEEEVRLHLQKQCRLAFPEASTCHVSGMHANVLSVHEQLRLLRST
jgi:hypothetical protein